MTPPADSPPRTPADSVFHRVTQPHQGAAQTQASEPTGLRTADERFRDRVEDIRDELLLLQQMMDVELDPSSDLYLKLREITAKLQQLTSSAVVK